MHRVSQVQGERFLRRGSRKARETAPWTPYDGPQQCLDSHLEAEFVVGGASLVNNESVDFDFELKCEVQEHRHLSQQDIGVTAPAHDADS